MNASPPDEFLIEWARQLSKNLGSVRAMAPPGMTLGQALMRLAELAAKPMPIAPPTIVPLDSTRRHHGYDYSKRLPPDAQVPLHYVVETLSISQSTVWRYVAKGLLPPPVRTGVRCTRWLAGELRQIREARAGGANDEFIQAMVRGMVKNRRTYAKASKAAT